MKFKFLFRVGILILATAGVLNINSCSVIGFGLGSINDSLRPDFNTIPLVDLKETKPGTLIFITQKNNRQINGKFVDYEILPENQYAQVYPQARERLMNVTYLPALGDSFDLPGARRVFFAGFDFSRIMFKTRNGKMLIGKITTVDTLKDCNGNVVAIESVNTLITEGKIPVASAIQIMATTKKMQVKMDSVLTVQVQNKKLGKWHGFMYGVGFDLIILLMIVTFQSNFNLTI